MIQIQGRRRQQGRRKYTVYLQLFHFIHNFHTNIKTKKIKPPLGNTSVLLQPSRGRVTSPLCRRDGGALTGRRRSGRMPEKQLPMRDVQACLEGLRWQRLQGVTHWGHCLASQEDDSCLPPPPTCPLPNSKNRSWVTRLMSWGRYGHNSRDTGCLSLRRAPNLRDTGETPFLGTDSQSQPLS